MIRNLVSIGEVIALLNDANRTDPDAIAELFLHRVKCNELLLNHPTIQCAGGDDKPGAGFPASVGVLGLINGIFSVDGRDYGPITMRIDEESGFVTEFIRTADAFDFPDNRRAGEDNAEMHFGFNE